MTNTTLTDPAIQIGTCVSCKTTYRAEVIGSRVITDLGGETAGYCGCRAEHGQPDSWVQFGKVITVVYAAEVTCGARCYSAKSATCKCSCSGDGHGKAHEVAG